MESDRIRALSYEDLKLYTDDFCEDNLIGNFQFGKVYRGYIGEKVVTIKIWEDPKIYNCYPGDNEQRLRDEIVLLQDPKINSHPNLVKLIGYCCEDEEQLGVIYDLKPLDSLYNLILKDNFTWLQRIKVVFGLACLLKVMHDEDPTYLPYLVHNIDAAHIMLDQDYNPKLCDFSMISGGILPAKTRLPNPYVLGCYGYIDLHSCRIGKWSEEVDVFAFGVLLLMLMSKRVFTEEDRSDFNVPLVYEWAQSVYKPKRSVTGIGKSVCSLVHRSLLVKPGFYYSDGHEITKLAMRCVEYFPSRRPTMKQIVKHLLDLRVIRRYADILGIHQMLRSHGVFPQKDNLALT